MGRGILGTASSSLPAASVRNSTIERSLIYRNGWPGSREKPRRLQTTMATPAAVTLLHGSRQRSWPRYNSRIGRNKDCFATPLFKVCERTNEPLKLSATNLFLGTSSQDLQCRTGKFRGVANRGQAPARHLRVEPSARSSSSPVEAEVAGVRLSHPNKLVVPEQGLTKLDVARYYEQIADRILPYLADRPLVLVRCPGGSGQKCFFQKHPGSGAPAALRRLLVKEKHRTEDYLMVDDLAGLVMLVQMGVLEIHVWGSRADQIEKPDRLVFDLDPDALVDWSEVVAAARQVKLILDELGLKSFVKTTGGKGLHVVVPIVRRQTWPEVKAFCRAVSELMVGAAPDHYINTASKAKRKEKIFIDYLRNDRGPTSVAPYSTRARSGAPVSVPLAWEELTARLKSDYFTVANLSAHLAKQEVDPWGDLPKSRQSLTAAMLKRLKLR